MIFLIRWVFSPLLFIRKALQEVSSVAGGIYSEPGCLFDQYLQTPPGQASEARNSRVFLMMFSLVGSPAV
jgi:hypothetical protein